MRRFLSLMLLLSVMLTCMAGAVPAQKSTTVRVGLYYGSSALAAPQLQNFIGHGYTAGYYDVDNNFHGLYSISEEKLVMLKDSNYVKSADNTYSEGKGTIGAYHVQNAETYMGESEARTAALAVGGFVAYDGAYRVRIGSYATAQEAQAAITESQTVVGGAQTGITVAQTDTGTILFEYDAGQTFAIAPNGTKTQTWCKGYKYYGNFAYPRTSGSNLSVINYVDLEDYVKGVVPYEMSASWPLEALKAQAVCARSYVLGSLGKHKSDGFDVCATTHCQVYHGTNLANETSDAAVDQTMGKHATVNGEVVTLFFFAADGGATESAVNVWGGDYAYLQGVIDPYEKTASANNGVWNVTLTAEQVASKLKNAGYSIGTVTDVTVTALTDTGNVLQVTVTDSAGKTVKIEKSKCRGVFGLNSQRYNVTGNHGLTTGTTFSATVTAASVVQKAQITEDTIGASILLGAQEVYQIPSEEEQKEDVPDSTSGTVGTGNSGAVSTTFTFSGQGWGHHVGMSQCGAKAMAEQGKNYQEILNFYYTGIMIAE